MTNDENKKGENKNTSGNIPPLYCYISENVVILRTVLFYSQHLLE